jgi:hypothetical protein
VSGWTGEDLQRIGRADELRLASRREDGSLRRFTTMWVVRAGNNLYVRSAGGPKRPWYRHALAGGAGRIQAAGAEADVVFAAAAPETSQDIDSAYHAKYDRYGPAILGHVTGPAAHAVTIRLIKAVRQGDAHE